MNLTLTVVLLVIATWRATRLVVEDDFPPIARVRDFVVRHAEIHETVSTALGTKTVTLTTLRWYGELISCPWCVSVWLAAGGTFLVWLTRDGGLPLPFLVFGAVAGGAASLYAVVDRVVSGTCDDGDGESS